MLALTDWWDSLPADAATLTATIPPDWGQGRAVFGGLVSGFALKAAQALVDPDRTLRSALVTFVAPAAPGPATARATLLRAGRALTLVRAEVVQKDAVKAVVVAGYGAARATTLAVPGAPVPAQRFVTDGLNLPYVAGVVPEFTRGFDYRWDPTALPFTGASEARIDGEVRLRGAARVDALGLLALLDAWPAPVLPLASRPVAASTVTWQVNVVGAMPAEGWPGDGFWRFHSDCVVSAEGYADMDARIWSPDGALVATSRQLVAEFSAR